MDRQRVERSAGSREALRGSRTDLRRIGEETSDRYEYIPARIKVTEDTWLTYACACTVKTATKPQPIEEG